MMRFGRFLVGSCGALALAFGTAAPTITLAEGWGTVEGQFVLADGDLPKLAPLVSKGDPSARDADVCAADGVPDDSLVINPESRGIANICLYLRSAPGEIHPDLIDSKEPEVVFDQKGCRFRPHVLIVRTDQTVLIKSNDPVAHNTRTSPFANQPINYTIRPKDREGVPVEMPQSELRTPPVKVSCDIHAWMSGYWMVADHPYVAVTDADGKFRIENLPEGTHKFRVWQERSGYVKTKVFNRDLEVTIEDGKVTDLGLIPVSAEIFFKD